MSSDLSQQWKRCGVRLAVLTVVCAMAPASDASALEYVIEAVALEGEPAPHGAGTYDVFFTGNGLSLNNLGDIGFSAGLSGGTAHQGSHVIHSDGSATVILNTDVPPTPPGGTYAHMGAPRLNDAGEFAFSAGVQLGGPSLGYAWFVQHASGLEMVAQIGEPVPELIDTTWSWNTDQVSALPTGEVLLGAPLQRPSGDGSGLFIIGESSFDVVVTDGDPMPVPGSPTFGWLAPWADSNSAGDVVFHGSDDTGGLGGLYARTDGNLNALAVEGEPAPVDPSSNFSFAFDPRPSLNESGQVAFSVYLYSNTGILDRGVFVVQPDGSIALVTREGDPVPGAPERSFTNYGRAPVINTAGDVMFTASSRAGAGPVVSGVYLWHEGAVSTIVESGTEVPESGGATLTGFSDVAIDFNDSGVVAFVAGLDDERRGVYRAKPVAASVPMLAPASLVLLTVSLAAAIAWPLRRRGFSDPSRETNA